MIDPQRVQKLNRLGTAILSDGAIMSQASPLARPRRRITGANPPLNVGELTPVP